MSCNAPQIFLIVFITLIACFFIFMCFLGCKEIREVEKDIAKRRMKNEIADEVIKEIESFMNETRKKGKNKK